MKHAKNILRLILVAFAVAASSAVWPVMAATGVTAVVPAEQQPQVRVVSGGVEIVVHGETDVHVTVYALTGQAVRTLEATPGVTSVDLPKGYYIVKCDNVSCRVIVK